MVSKAFVYWYGWNRILQLLIRVVIVYLRPDRFKSGSFLYYRIVGPHVHNVILVRTFFFFFTADWFNTKSTVQVNECTPYVIFGCGINSKCQLDLMIFCISTGWRRQSTRVSNARQTGTLRPSWYRRVGHWLRRERSPRSVRQCSYVPTLDRHEIQSSRPRQCFVPLLNIIWHITQFITHK
jgi:hypothetical protein